MVRPLSLLAVFHLLLSLHGFSQKKNVLIVYYSMGNHTKQMAEAVASGVGTCDNVRYRMMSVENATPSDLISADAVILGSPVYNANPAPEVLDFIRKWPFEGQPLKNKLGAVFVTAGGMSAGEEFVQLSLLRSMMVFGMIAVGGSDWTMPFGASAVFDEGKYKGETLDAHFYQKGYQLGKRVAQLLEMFK